MGIFSFFKLSENSDEKIQKLLCLTVWGIGGVVLLLNWIDSVFWLLTYPHPNWFGGATCMMNLALRVFVLWMPMSFLLLEWRSKMLSFILYMVGGVLAILLSLLALGLTLPLLLATNKSLAFADNYFGLVKGSIQKGNVPRTMLHAVSFENCCSWYGPADFGSQYKIRDKDRDKNEEFMRDVKICVGKVFDVQPQPNGYLKYTPGNQVAGAEIPTGCSAKYIARANRIAVLIIVMTIIICTVTPVLLMMHFKIYKRLGLMARAVRPGTSAQVHQAQTTEVVQQSHSANAEVTAKESDTT